MALVAQDVIEAARDFHPAFTPNDFSDKMLLRQLYRLERSLFEAVVKVDEEALAENRAIPAALVRAALKTENGVSLPEHYLLLSAKVRYADGEPIPVEFVTYKGGVIHGGFPLMSVVGQRLHPVEHDEWGNIKDVLVRYVPLPEKLTTLDQELTIPEAAEDALIFSLVSFMATRGNFLSQLPGLPAQVQAAQQNFIDGLNQQDTTTLWTVRKVV